MVRGSTTERSESLSVESFSSIEVVEFGSCGRFSSEKLCKRYSKPEQNGRFKKSIYVITQMTACIKVLVTLTEE